MNHRERINEKGLKITWLANQIGIAQSSLSSFLSGNRTIPKDKLNALEELLK